MKRGFTVLEIVIAAGIVLILVAVAIPAYMRIKDKAKEGEVKSGLHSIQVAVERFAEDNEGTYPQYLIGGDLKNGESIPFNRNVHGSVFDLPDLVARTGVSDPLLRRGYIDSYPRNPFARNGSQVIAHQDKVGDPLRLAGEGKIRGFRFGGSGKIMGNVSADLRFPEFRKVAPGPTPEHVKSHANFEGYPFFDVWQKGGRKVFMPGEFFYKSNGPVVVKDLYAIDPIQPIQPVEIDQYILGVFGSVRSRGSDILGHEAEIRPFSDQAFDIVIMAPSWTRWVNQQVGNDFPGSPYGPSAPIGLEQLTYGNPNGIRDGLILVLTAD